MTRHRDATEKSCFTKMFHVIRSIGAPMRQDITVTMGRHLFPVNKFVLYFKGNLSI